MKTNRIPTNALAGVVLAASVAGVAAVAAVANPAPPEDGGPGTPPVTTPTGSPVMPSPVAPAPSGSLRDSIPVRVDLLNATGHNVVIDIVDRTGTIVESASGNPGDGMTVEAITVENVDARTLKVTWADFPGDSALGLFVDRTATGFRFVLVQPRRNADAMGYDRILVLTFDAPVSAADVEAILQDEPAG